MKTPRQESIERAAKLGLQLRDLSPGIIVGGGPQYIGLRQLNALSDWIEARYGTLGPASGSGEYWHTATQQWIQLPTLEEIGVPSEEALMHACR